MKKRLGFVLFLILGICLCFWISNVQGQNLTGPAKGLKSKTTEQVKIEGTKKLIVDITGQVEIGDEIVGKVDGKNQVILRKVWEKQFDEPVSDIVFDEEEVMEQEAQSRNWNTSILKKIPGRFIKDKIKVNYPKTLFVPKEISFRKNHYFKEIKFLNNKGSITKKILPDKSKGGGDWTETSPNKKYLLMIHGTNFGGSLYNDKGDLIWDKYGSGHTPVAVSDEGYVVATYIDEETAPPGDSVFYDPQGKELGRIKDPYEEKGTVFSTVGFIDNDYVMLAFRWVNKTALILSTKKGEILWSKEFDYTMFKWGQYIAKKELGIIGISEIEKPDYSGITYVIYVDLLGNLKWVITLEIGGDYIVKLSSDNKKAYIISSAGYIGCIDIDEGKILWKYKEEYIAPSFWRPASFYEIEITEKYVYVIGKYINWGIENEWLSSVFYIFDSMNGNLLQKIEYPNKHISLNMKNNQLSIIDIDAKTMKMFDSEVIEK